MTDDAELEAQIRARDAAYSDCDIGKYESCVRDRRTLLRLLDEVRAELDIQLDVGRWHIHDVVKALEDNETLRAELSDTAARLAKAEAEVERLRNMAMTVKGMISINVAEYGDVRNAIEMLESAALSTARPSETP